LKLSRGEYTSPIIMLVKKANLGLTCFYIPMYLVWVFWGYTSY
jgi:hypothetical protein